MKWKGWLRFHFDLIRFGDDLEMFSKVWQGIVRFDKFLVLFYEA